MMRFCDQQSCVNQVNLNVPPGRYEGFYLKINGTAAASYARSSVGTIVGYLNGHVLWSFDFGHFVDITNRLFGTAVDTAGTTFAYAMYLPMAMPGFGRGVPGLGNAIFIDPADTCFFTIPGTGTTTATATLYATPSFSPTKFILKVAQVTQTLASGTMLFETQLDNTIAIFVFDAATTDPTNVRVKVDDDERFSALWQHGEDFGNMISRVETAVAGLHIDLNPTRTIEEMVNKKCEVEVTGGSGAQDYIIFATEFDMERSRRSMESVAQASVKAQSQIRAQRQTLKSLGVSSPTGRANL